MTKADLVAKISDKLGIEKGDVVIKMGGFEVKNMTDYMECLGKFEPKSRVDVVVNRNGKTIIKQVVF